jgi:hypothetical protein
LPTWWSKFEALSSASLGAPGFASASEPVAVGPNIDVSTEAGPQSETSIAVNPTNPSQIVAGSNEIFRNPMRGYFSADGGSTWRGVDLPLPPPIPGSKVDFGSDPGVAWDLKGHVYYTYIVVFFTKGFAAVTGSEMAVARSSDGGRTWTPTYFALHSHPNPFDDKPMITVDTNAQSPHVNTVYAAWDLTGTDQADSDGIFVSRSTDQGRTFSAPVHATPIGGSGPKGDIGADPFVGASGTLYVAWNDFQNIRIAVSSSTDGGRTFGLVHTIAHDEIGFDIGIPAQASRHALLYPACGAAPASRPATPDLLYCSWIDGSLRHGVKILFAESSDGGRSWSTPIRVNDDASSEVNDHFNQWLAVDPTDGVIHVSWYDTRLDPSRMTTNVFYAQSTDHGLSFGRNVRVTTAPTNETSSHADLGNQYGDYEGIAAFDGLAHPVWTDRRTTVSFLDEEVFTATLRNV